MPHTVEDKLYLACVAEEYGARVQEWGGNKRRQTQTVVALAQGLGHHLRVSSQYMGGEFSVKGFKGCDLVVGRKGIYSRVLVKTPFKKCLAG